MNKIKELREARGWNQDFLGQKLNVKRAAVSKYENGKIPLTDGTIMLLSEIFDVSSDYILGKAAYPKKYYTDPPLSAELADLHKESCDLDNEEIKKVLEYVELLKLKRNSSLF